MVCTLEKEVHRRFSYEFFIHLIFLFFNAIVLLDYANY